MVFLRYGGLFWSSIPAPPYPPIWNGILGFKMRPANKIVVWRPLLLAKFRPQLKMFSGHKKNSSFPHVVIFLSLCLVPQCSVTFSDRDIVCLFILTKSRNWLSSRIDGKFRAQLKIFPGRRIQVFKFFKFSSFSSFQVFHMWSYFCLSVLFHSAV